MELRSEETIKIKIDGVSFETEKAWKVFFIKGNLKYERWFPKSRCSMDGMEITVPSWLLKDTPHKKPARVQDPFKGGIGVSISEDATPEERAQLEAIFKKVLNK